MLIFYLYWIFLPSVQMKTFVPVGSIAWYKCFLTGARQDLLLVTRYKYAYLYRGKRNPVQMPSNANALPTLIFDTLAFSHRVILPGCPSLSTTNILSPCSVSLARGGAPAGRTGPWRSCCSSSPDHAGLWWNCSSSLPGRIGPQ